MRLRFYYLVFRHLLSCIKTGPVLCSQKSHVTYHAHSPKRTIDDCTRLLYRYSRIRVMPRKPSSILNFVAYETLPSVAGIGTPIPSYSERRGRREMLSKPQKGNPS